MANPQAPSPRQYAANIASLCILYKDLPHTLGKLDLYRSIKAGDPIDRQNLVDAELVANALRVIHDIGLDPRITQEVADTAELRVFAIRSAHANAFFPFRAESTNINPHNVVKLGNALDQIRQLLDQTSQLFRTMDNDQRLDPGSQRIDGIGQRLDVIHQCLESIEGGLQGVIAIFG